MKATDTPPAPSSARNLCPRADKGQLLIGNGALEALSALCLVGRPVHWLLVAFRLLTSHLL